MQSLRCASCRSHIDNKLALFRHFDATDPIDPRSEAWRMQHLWGRRRTHGRSHSAKRLCEADSSRAAAHHSCVIAWGSWSKSTNISERRQVPDALRSLQQRSLGSRIRSSPHFLCKQSGKPHNQCHRTSLIPFRSWPTASNHAIGYWAHCRTRGRPLSQRASHGGHSRLHP